MKPFLTYLVLIGTVVGASSQGQAAPAPLTKGATNISFTLTAKAFQHQTAIPVRFTGEGTNVSPALAWSNAPAQTASFVLICDDPDTSAGTWVHWVLYDIPGDMTSLREGIQKEPLVLGTAKQGKNDANKIGYHGPMPPPGNVHRYFFKLYALNIVTDKPAGLTKAQVLKAMEGHIIGTAEMYGTYKR